MRRWGIVLAVLGLLMLAVGAALRFVVVPRAQVLPADADQTVTYTGTLMNMDVAALMRGDREVVSLPVTVKRTLKVLQTSGDNARVSDTAIMSSSRGTVPPSLARTEYFYAVDRSNLEAVPNFTDKPVTNAKGLVAFPIGTERRSYTVWVPELGMTGTLRYVGEDRLEGLTVYRFKSVFTEILPTPPTGAPTTVSPSQLPALAKAMGLPAHVQQFLAEFTTQWTPQGRPWVQYTFTESDSYAVEPDSGVIVDTTKKVWLTMALNGMPNPPMPVTVLDIRYDAASIAAMADKASSHRNAVRLYGSSLPAGLGVAALACLAMAVKMVRTLHESEHGVGELADTEPGRADEPGPEWELVGPPGPRRLTGQGDTSTGRSGSATHSLHEPG